MRLFLPSTRGWRDKGPGAARRAGAGAAVWAQPSGQDTGPILRYCGRSLNAAFCPLPVRLQTHKLHLLFFSQEEKSAFAVKGAGLADRGLSAPQRPAAAPQHQAPPVPPGHRRSPPPHCPQEDEPQRCEGSPLRLPGRAGRRGRRPLGKLCFAPHTPVRSPPRPEAQLRSPPLPDMAAEAPPLGGGGAELCRLAPPSLARSGRGQGVPRPLSAARARWGAGHWRVGAAGRPVPWRRRWRPGELLWGEAGPGGARSAAAGTPSAPTGA